MFIKKQFEDEKYSNEPTPLFLACKEFDQIYKTEEDCIEELVRILGPENLYCRFCNSEEISRSYGTRALLCFDCKRGSSSFKDTNFEGIKKPRAWLLGFWLIGRGIEFNSHRFHYFARIAYSTALTIVKKLAAIVNSDLKREVDTIHSNVFTSVFKKRSTQTPAQRHPCAEQEEMEKESLDFTKTDIVDEIEITDEIGVDENIDLGGETDLEKYDQARLKPLLPDQLGEREKALYELLSEEKKHFDHLLYALKCSVGELCVSIFNLEVSELIQRHGGDYYTLRRTEIKVTTSPQSKFTPAVREFIEFINTKFHGISRKCLHLYLALFWTRVNRSRWNTQSLAKACREHPPITGKEVLSLVCPLVVNLADTIGSI